MRKIILSFLSICSLSISFAGEWKGLDDANWYSGKKLSLKDLRRKIIMVEEWDSSVDASETMGFVEKCYRGYSSHPFVLIASHKGVKDDAKVKASIAANSLTCPVYQGVEYTSAPQSGKVPFMYVVDTSGKVIYSGHDKNEAITAVVNAITDMPITGYLISGVSLKKFRSLKNKIAMGKKVEGALLSPVKAALKSKKAAERAEAQAIIDAIEKAKKNLEEEIEEEKAAGDCADKGILLRDIRWLVTTWPSEKDRYKDDFSKLLKDPEAIQGEKAWYDSQKKKVRRR